jgi:hypothetical protein
MKRPNSHGSRFNRKMEPAIQALCTQRNLEEVARAVGIGKPTMKGRE